jgi:pimeloyl-ACP methyl ester carboxylesterase
MALLGALRLRPAILAGYDWGGLASCVATALWPERVAGLVSLASYDVLDIERQRHADTLKPGGTAGQAGMFTARHAGERG